MHLHIENTNSAEILIVVVRQIAVILQSINSPRVPRDWRPVGRQQSPEPLLFIVHQNLGINFNDFSFKKMHTM